MLIFDLIFTKYPARAQETTAQARGRMFGRSAARTPYRRRTRYLRQNQLQRAAIHRMFQIVSSTHPPACHSCSRQCVFHLSEEETGTDGAAQRPVRAFSEFLDGLIDFGRIPVQFTPEPALPAIDRRQLSRRSRDLA